MQGDTGYSRRTGAAALIGAGGIRTTFVSKSNQFKELRANRRCLEHFARPTPAIFEADFIICGALLAICGIGSANRAEYQEQSNPWETAL
jgi:hypothetical protein